MSKAKDLTGQRFGKLVVVKRAGSKKTKGGVIRATWWCQCDCGSPLKEIKSTSLLMGHTKSCGCLKTEQCKNKHKTNYYNLSGDYGIGYTSKGEEFFFDLEDYDKIKDYCWYINNRGYVTTGIHKPNNKHATIFLHILIKGKKDGYVIDHADKNKSNNRKSNLRQATVSQNGMNSKLRKNISGITGVRLDKRCNKWCATITLNQKSIWLGEYADKDDAIKARLLAEAKYFGDFAPQHHLFEQYGIEVDNEEQAN